MGSGLRQNLDYRDFKRLKLPIPTNEEQDNIAAFLDQKTSEIDQAIAKKQRLIDLLKEQQAILINRAVTQGLNPGVPMKNSGVEWIGEIPAHWQLKANRSLFFEKKDEGCEDLPILSVSLHTGVSSEEQNEEENVRAKIRIADKRNYKRVTTGDIVFNMMRAWQGAIGSVKTEGLVSPAYIVAKPVKDIDSEYFEMQYRTASFIQQMDRFSKGITDFRKRLYWDEFKQLFTIVPPIEEQRQIVEFCSNKIEDYERAIKIEGSGIEKLQEFKQTLIAHAVTGKIKV